MYFHYRFQCCR